MQWGSKLSKMESAGVALVVDPTATRDGTLWLRAEVARLSPTGHAVRLTCDARQRDFANPAGNREAPGDQALTTKPVGERPPPSRSRARAIDSHRAEEHWHPEVARCPTWRNGLSSDQLRTCNATDSDIRLHHHGDVTVVDHIHTHLPRPTGGHSKVCLRAAAACQIPGYANRGLR